MCANNEGSGETARMRWLAWAFAGRLCDIKYHNLMSWLIYVMSLMKVLIQKDLIYRYAPLGKLGTNEFIWPVGIYYEYLPHFLVFDVFGSMIFQRDIPVVEVDKVVNIEGRQWELGRIFVERVGQVDYEPAFTEAKTY